MIEAPVMDDEGVGSRQGLGSMQECNQKCSHVEAEKGSPKCSR